MPDDLALLDATAQAELVRGGQALPAELVDAAIKRVEELDGELNAVVTPLFDRARAAAEGHLPDGPLRGVPFLLKDLGALSEGEAYGPCRNPWDPGRSTGGSSGGSAAAVAGGPCPGDLHTPPQPARPYRDEVGADPGRLRVGLLTSAPGGSVATHPECAAAAEETARLLESLRHTVAPEYPRALADADIARAFLGAWTALGLDWWGRLLGRTLTADDVEPATWAVAEIRRGVSGTQFLAAQLERARPWGRRRPRVHA